MSSKKVYKDGKLFCEHYWKCGAHVYEFPQGKGKKRQMKYRVRNNTDYKVPFETNNKKEAQKVWNKIKPKNDAGNLYFAIFEKRCDKCGEWKDVNAEYDTCDCR